LNFFCAKSILDTLFARQRQDVHSSDAIGALHRACTQTLYRQLVTQTISTGPLFLEASALSETPEADRKFLATMPQTFLA
jgi:hypothetical protein